MWALLLSVCALAQTQIPINNPVIPPDHPDPHVIAVNGVYYLFTTPGLGDIPAFVSTDLVHWAAQPNGLFQRSANGPTVMINEAYFCNIWAPDMVSLSTGGYMLSFAASRFPSNTCSGVPTAGATPNLGIYTAWSSSPLGQFAIPSHNWEPIPTGPSLAYCQNLHYSLPHSIDYATDAGADECQGGPCQNIMRLDPFTFQDNVTKQAWAGYSWYTNNPPVVDWEMTNSGEHVSVTQLNVSDPFVVPCNASEEIIFIANPQDQLTLSRLAAYCDGCDQMLSNVKGRYNEDMTTVDGKASWGVNEGVGFFRRGNYIYALISGSAYDSAYYHVFFIAAKSIEQMDYRYYGDTRLVGRFLIPADGMSFGHGTPILAPDQKSWYYVHHRLQHDPCMNTGNCARDVWVSPIEFEDRGDGLGDVWIVPRWPTRDPPGFINMTQTYSELKTTSIL